VVIMTAPATADPTISRASAVIGGPRGRFAGATRWAPIQVLLAVASVTLLLGYAEKSPCASGNWVHTLQYTHVCYSDVIPLWGAEGLSDGAVPYRDHAVEYPVLTGGFLWVTAELTRGWTALSDKHLLPGKDPAVMFGVLTCMLLSFVGLTAVAATAGAAGRRRRWDAAIFAASPLLVFHAFSNWDLVAMAFSSGALWAWARNRPVLAGSLIGLGAAAKLYPALLLVPLVILAARSGRWRATVWAAGTAVATWIAVNAPVALAWHRGWWEFYAFSENRPAEASTVWAMLNHFYPQTFGEGGSWTPPGWVVAVCLLAALVLIAALGVRAPQPPRLAQLGFLVVAAFLLTTKVWSPQYSLWLVPLLALARPKWRSALIWQASEIVVWAATLLWLVSGSDANKGLTYEGLTATLLVRDAILLWLVAMVVREILDPALDEVRTVHEPDPGAGAFA